MADRTTWTADKFTFHLPWATRELLAAYAESQGESIGECLRRIIAEKFAQLQRGEESA